MTAVTGPRAAFSVDDVVAACRTLPPPDHRRILDVHPLVKPSATLLPIVDVDGTAGVVVTPRVGTLEHGGDWVFPGGRIERSDLSSADAARRETAEELGVDLADVSILGQLTTWGPIVTGHVVDVFVGRLASSVRIRPVESEVADVVIVAIADLLAPRAHHRGPARSDRDRRAAELARFGRPAHLDDLLHYRVREGEYLWGLQADILCELLAHLTGGGHAP